MKTLAELYPQPGDSVLRCEECHDEIDPKDEGARVIKGFTTCGKCVRKLKEIEQN
jgi:hypothetical protein